MMIKMKIWLCVLAVLVLGCSQSTGASGSEMAPDFTLQDLNNNSTFTLSSYRDKNPVMLLFWTTWCPYCRSELKLLSGVYSKLVEEGLQVITINIGESVSKVSAFAKSYDFPFRVLLDKDEAVAESYELLGIPTYILVDKKGKARFRTNSFPEKEYKSLLSE